MSVIYLAVLAVVLLEPRQLEPVLLRLHLPHALLLLLKGVVALHHVQVGTLQLACSAQEVSRCVNITQRPPASTAACPGHEQQPGLTLLRLQGGLQPLELLLSLRPVVLDRHLSVGGLLDVLSELGDALLEAVELRL